MKNAQNETLIIGLGVTGGDYADEEAAVLIKVLREPVESSSGQLRNLQDPIGRSALSSAKQKQS